MSLLGGTRPTALVRKFLQLELLGVPRARGRMRVGGAKGLGWELTRAKPIGTTLKHGGR